MEKSIVGREKEKAGLKEYMLSERSEFIAIYGRRRVGKTFLVKTFHTRWRIFSMRAVFLKIGQKHSGCSL